MSETRTVTVREPEVLAQIASPADGSSWPSRTRIQLDGTTSVGPPPLEARWVFFDGDTGEALPELESSGLTAEVVLPHRYGGLKARLVVAATGWLPDDLYTPGPPCSASAGDGLCGTAEVTLLNLCCPDPGAVCTGDDLTGLVLSIVEPPYNTNLPYYSTLQLRAQMTGGGSLTATYRWWVAPAADPQARTPRTRRATTAPTSRPSSQRGSFTRRPKASRPTSAPGS